MRDYNDIDENLKYLIRGKKDKEVIKSFNQEVTRALTKFMAWYKKGNTPYEAEIKMRRSYGAIISDMAIYYLSKNLSKK